jgi:oligopeptidase B
MSRRSPRSASAARSGAPTAARVFTEVNEHWRSYRARLHRLGTPASEDVTLYEETRMSASRSASAEPGPEPDLHRDRRQQLDRGPVRPGRRSAAPLSWSRGGGRDHYSVDARTAAVDPANDEHINFRLAEADPAAPASGARSSRFGPGLSARRHAVPRPSGDQERLHGLDQIRLRAIRARRADRLSRGELHARAGQQSRIRAGRLRLGYRSMVTPGRSTIIIRPRTGSRP